MRKVLQFWVLLPPLQGQQDLKDMQKYLASKNSIGLAMPPFLVLGEARKVTLEQFHQLGEWQVRPNLSFQTGYMGLDCFISGLEAFSQHFLSVAEYKGLPSAFLILSWLKGSCEGYCLAHSLTFHTYRLAEWKITLYYNLETWEGVEIETLQEFKKKRRYNKKERHSCCSFTSPRGIEPLLPE